MLLKNENPKICGTGSQKIKDIQVIGSALTVSIQLDIIMIFRSHDITIIIIDILFLLTVFSNVCVTFCEHSVM